MSSNAALVTVFAPSEGIFKPFVFVSYSDLATLQFLSMYLCVSLLRDFRLTIVRLDSRPIIVKSGHKKM